jgi:RND family efflux transporter MFP subunit
MASSPDNRLATLAGDQSKFVPAPRRSLTRRLFPVVLVLALAALFLLVARDRLQPATNVQTAAVVTKSVGADLSNAAGSVSVQAPGWVEPDPYPIYAGALASGIIDEILVLEGDPVTKGQPIARLVVDDAKLAVDRVTAELANRRAELQAATANWDNPTDLNRQVDVADARLGETAAALAELEALINQKVAQEAEARKILQRLSSAEPGTFAVLDVERAEFQLAARTAELAATRKKIPVLEATRIRQQAELAAAKESRELRIADRHRVDAAKAAVALAEAKLGEAQLRLERMVVRAPADGLVMVRLKSPGSKVMLDMDSPHSSHVAHLYDPKRLQVRVDVPLADAAKVSVGQDALIVVDVLPDVEFKGKVTRFVHAADLSKNTLQAKVAIDAPSSLLKPDMLARVKFLATKTAADQAATGTDSTVLVPTGALVGANDTEASVWVLNAHGDRIRAQAIKLGPVYQDSWRLVREGLNPGDVVVINPPSTLQDGQRVTASGGN